MRQNTNASIYIRVCRSPRRHYIWRSAFSSRRRRSQKAKKACKYNFRSNLLHALRPSYRIHFLSIALCYLPIKSGLWYYRGGIISISLLKLRKWEIFIIYIRGLGKVAPSCQPYYARMTERLVYYISGRIWYYRHCCGHRSIIKMLEMQAFIATISKYLSLYALVVFFIMYFGHFDKLYV